MTVIKELYFVFRLKLENGERLIGPQMGGGGGGDAMKP